MKAVILNDRSSDCSPMSAEALYTSLMAKMNELKGLYYDANGGGVDYHQLRLSPAFQEYKQIANALCKIRLEEIQEPAQQLAFWINIYNALVVHGIAELGIARSVKDVSSFFKRICYDIGGHVFSSDDIEHGILRGNRRKHLLASKPFVYNDPRVAYALRVLDPRIHFALVCGSKSCPPIGIYHEDRIDTQLDMATSNFIQSDVEVDRETGVLHLSKVFQWYQKDFGSRDEMIHFILSYRRDELEQNYLRLVGSQIKLQYLPYDWELNHIGVHASDSHAVSKMV
ncbi:DUF547 domain-containing protein [Candidatus Entotheonella serta]|nr:DUF547 domain-containing protein [Candidatus Entotheonella serta]